MDHQLHAAGERAGRPRKNARRRAGLPAKRFFTRYAALSDVPPEDLALLAERLHSDLTLDPSSPVPVLRSIVRREIHRRGDATRG